MKNLFNRFANYIKSWFTKSPSIPLTPNQVIVHNIAYEIPTPTLLEVARKEIGVSEIPGPESNNPRILEYSQFIGEDWVKDEDTSWCGIFMGYVAKTCGKPLPKGPASARSWLSVGQNVDSNPQPGDVVIFWRESPESWKGHVALFLEYNEDKSLVSVLGGNQNNCVCIANYGAQRILGFRRL